MLPLQASPSVGSHLAHHACAACSRQVMLYGRTSLERANLRQASISHLSAVVCLQLLCGTGICHQLCHCSLSAARPLSPSQACEDTSILQPVSSAADLMLQEPPCTGIMFHSNLPDAMLLLQRLPGTPTSQLQTSRKGAGAHRQAAAQPAGKLRQRPAGSRRAQVASHEIQSMCCGSQQSSSPQSLVEAWILS